jgi:prepilin-type N-terminal cleavage/methylation domain-containing protein
VKSRELGFSLPELMVSMTVGLLLLAAFFSVAQRCREAFSAGESVAGLQDNARHALSVIVPDIEHAGFFGFAGSAAIYTRGGTVLAEGPQLQQPDAAHSVAAVPGLPAGAHDCASTSPWTCSFSVQGSNNSYVTGAAATRCAPTASAGGARAGSDTLTLRHASLESTKPLAGRLQLYSRRLESQAAGELFADGRAPGPIDANADVRNLEVRKYYVANDSVDRPPVAGAAHKGAHRVTRRGAVSRRGSAARCRRSAGRDWACAIPRTPRSPLCFVAPDFPATAGRMRWSPSAYGYAFRADRTEAGYFDARPLRYADVEFVPDALESRQRRAVIQRTVALRNLRSAVKRRPTRSHAGGGPDPARAGDAVRPRGRERGACRAVAGTGRGLSRECGHCCQRRYRDGHPRDQEQSRPCLRARTPHRTHAGSADTCEVGLRFMGYENRCHRLQVRILPARTSTS